MAHNDHHPHEPTSSQPSNSSSSSSIAIPPRSSFEALINGGEFSPAPMSLVSSFFSDAEDCKSFSQLLAGALTSPSADFRLQSPLFSMLESPGISSTEFGPLGMSHQQVLAQVTALASAQNGAEYLPGSFPVSSNSEQEMPSLKPASTRNANTKSYQSAFVIADKPNEDGYNWRKYGQKQVKGSEFPRSYYKCTHPKCPVKKKVERSLDGQVTEIIYKGQHSHQLPLQSNKRGKDVGNSNGNPENGRGYHDLASQVQSGHFSKSRDRESNQETHEETSGNSDSEEVGPEENDGDEPEPKRRSMEVRHSVVASSHRTVTEPRIVVQTTSAVDLLDDGYKWRKYGQKVVKGNPYPRSYYKCTAPGCNVRKHVERASSDPKAVITTYEGKHNHDVPAAKSSSHNTTDSSATNKKLQNSVAENHGLVNRRGPKNNTQQSKERFRLKEEKK